MTRLLRVGLTGGIASGKSHVLRRLAAAGFAAVDLDDVAHGLLSRGGAAYEDVVAAFGPGILDDSRSIDRKALGEIVFASGEARARLDGIVHPLVRAQEAAIASAARAAGARALVTDAALLVEAGLHLRFDRLIAAWCAPRLQVERLRARDGIGEEAARARLAAQMPGEEKRAYAHFVVDTSGTFDRTDEQVDAVAARLRALDPAPPLPLGPGRAEAALERGPAGGPRGLQPVRLVAEFGSARGFDMARLGRALEPPAAGPWYRAARSGEAPGPEALAAAIAVCCAARGADPPYVLGAAYSLGRLTHRDPGAVAAGCVAALAAWAVAEEGSLAPLRAEALASWAADARGRAGAAAPAAVTEELRSAAAGGGAPGTLAAALAGLAGLAPSTNRPSAATEAVARLSDVWER